MTQTANTVICYLHTAELLEKRARSELGLDPSGLLRSTDFVAWAIALRPRIAPSSWRQYKAALRCSIGRKKGGNAREALVLLQGADSSICHKAVRNTSAQKARKLTSTDFKAIQDYLMGSRGKWSRPAAVWLAAGSLTGLRPAEWFGARLLGHANGKILLNVRNAKATNGRAHGPTRILDLSELELGLISLVRRHLAFVGQFADAAAFKSAYIGCMKTLYRATRTLWPARQHFVCLYTGRHQFSADAKAGGLTRAEVAALMGHASDRSAAAHYARRKSGQSGFRIRPNPAEVALVRRKAVSHAEYLARKLQRAATLPYPTR